MNTRNKSQYEDLKIGKTGCLIFMAIAAVIIISIFVLRTETYSEGERIGFLTKFSRKGRIWKSWEGELNLTQTGMNTSSLFDFSIDNDKDDAKVIALIDSAVTNGWKVKLKYHETFAKNWFNNRGETSHFVEAIDVLDRTPMASLQQNGGSRSGHIIDTIYVVIDKSQLKK